MKTRYCSPTRRSATLCRLLALLALTCAFGAAALAQQTAGGTQISNTATASYQDSGGTNYSTTSLPVVVTVANVAGLAITPDGGGGSVVAGNTNASVVFTVTNTGNFADTVTFQANGASLIVGGAINMTNVTAAFVDANSNGTFDGTDVNILTNGAAVQSASVAAGGSIAVVVKYSVPTNATGSVTIQLGDTPGAGNGDNAVANLSANEVRNTTAGVNGRSEGRGNYSVSVLTDATLQTYLTAPAGPIAPGSDITYTQFHTCNTGTQTATAITLTNAPVGFKTGVFEIVPIPLQTSLAAGQTFPAGTLYSTDALTVSPITATWTTSAPGTLSLVKRIAFNRGASLAAGACTSDLSYKVTIDSNANANIPVLAIVDSFANNTFSNQITDQSGDTVAGAGNGRADLSPAGSLPDGSNLSQPGNVDGDGVLLPTLIAKVGSVLNGPVGFPAATGPTNTTNDDFTNKSVNTGIAGVPPGSNTNAGGVVTFTNTVQNTGNADDIFTLSVPNFASMPSGTVIVITTPNGTVTINAGNAAGTAPINVARNGTANYTVQVTLPTNQPVLAGYDAQLRATSTNTPANNNLTIDRTWTGFVRLIKQPATIINGTGNGGPTDAVPGAVIEYVINYSNVTGGNGSGSNNGLLSATSVVISEDGAAGTNNWATYTTMVLVPAPSDSNGGTVTDGATSGAVTASTNFLKDTIATLAPGASGTFTFRRTIK